MKLLSARTSVIPHGPGVGASRASPCFPWARYPEVFHTVRWTNWRQINDLQPL